MIHLYDTTLRDGSQGEGVVFSVEDKLLIIKALDQLGIHYIEGGYPGSNPKDVDFFKKAQELELKTSEIVPFGSTYYPKYQPEDDPNLKALLDTGSKTVTIFGKTWKLHALDVLRVPHRFRTPTAQTKKLFLVELHRDLA